MTEAQLAAEMKRLSSTYPKWMDKADALLTWQFRSRVNKAHGLATAKRRDDRWQTECRALIRDFRDLRIRVENPIAC